MKSKIQRSFLIHYDPNDDVQNTVGFSTTIKIKNQLNWSSGLEDYYYVVKVYVHKTDKRWFSNKRYPYKYLIDKYKFWSKCELPAINTDIIDFNQTAKQLYAIGVPRTSSIFYVSSYDTGY